MEREILGIDIGGTGIKWAIVDTETGALLSERKKIATPKPATPEAVSKCIQEQIRMMGWKDKPIGLGLPSVVRRGIARTAANIDNSWLDVNVDDFFTQRLECPCKVINDADAAGWAEVAFGKGKEENGVVLLLTLGTGIGSALFCDGKLVPNTELGHAHFKKDIAEKHASNHARKIGKLDWAAWGGRLNELLLYYDRLFSPDLFILGGGVSKKFELYQNYLDIDHLNIAPATLQNDAGIIGAALCAKNAFHP